MLSTASLREYSGWPGEKLTARAMARCFLDNEQRIYRMARRAEGPYVVSVSGNGLRRVTLNLSRPL